MTETPEQTIERVMEQTKRDALKFRTLGDMMLECMDVEREACAQIAEAFQQHELARQIRCRDALYATLNKRARPADEAST